jgi:hypothetical protein
MKASWISEVTKTASHGHDAVGDALGRDHDVGRHAEIIGAEGLPEAPEAGDHLVEDEQDAVLVADLAKAA